ncbi:MAG: hypothetical protein ACOYN0_13965, partial [Phycisphaerales bacterium]
AGQQPCPPPLLVSGFATSVLLRELWRQSREFVGGYAPRLYVVEEDAQLAAGGLCCEDLRDIIADGRVMWWLGPGARRAFAGWCRERMEEMLPAAALPSEGRQTPADALNHRVLEELKTEQAAALARLRAGVDSVYATRDRAWWAERYAVARSLRILVLSCRHTTYVRHAAADLAAALVALGHDVRVLEEPDSHTRLTALSYARVVREHRPDLLIGVNFQRSSFTGAVPAGVPFVCWIQDAMAHLFDPKQGEAQSALDFVIGHTFAELFQKFGYSAARSMNCAVVASDAKFHGGAVAPALRREFECEVAMVSHHSETPEALHARLGTMFNSIPGAGPLIERLYPLVRGAASLAGAEPLTTSLKTAVARAGTEALGRELDGRTATQLLRQYAHPLADRLMRHETLGWASAECARRGWRMHLYGKGWGGHPTLAAHARGELEHGERLRAAYQCAAVQLHCSATGMVHQRVMECALSGGLCVCRFHRDALAGPRTTMRTALVAKAPDLVDEAMNAVGYRVADHPEAMRFVSLWQRLGEKHEGEYILINRDRARMVKEQEAWIGLDHDADRLLGDLALLSFDSAASLAALIERCVERPAWRESASRMVAGNVRRWFTHRVVGERLVGLVRGSLAERTS